MQPHTPLPLRGRRTVRSISALVAALLVFAGAAALSPAHANDTTTGTSVSIRVVDAISGKPVSDATVELLGRWWNHRPQFNPATGAYDLSVDDSSLVLNQMTVTHATRKNVVNVAITDAIALGATLPAGSYELTVETTHEPGIEGVVMTVDEEPLSNIKFQAKLSGVNMNYGGTTDENGRYQIGKVPPGTSIDLTFTDESGVHTESRARVDNVTAFVTEDIVMVSDNALIVKVRHGNNNYIGGTLTALDLDGVQVAEAPIDWQSGLARLAVPAGTYILRAGTGISTEYFGDSATFEDATPIVYDGGVQRVKETMVIAQFVGQWQNLHVNPPLRPGLTLHPGSSGLPSTVDAIRWQREVDGTWADIPGATFGSYTVTDADLGLRLRWRYWGGGFPHTTTTPIGPVVLATTQLWNPMTSSFGVSVGHGADVNLYSNVGTIDSVTYTWKLNNVPIPGATAQRYVPRPADEGKTLSLDLEARHQGYTPQTKTLHFGTVARGQMITAVQNYLRDRGLLPLQVGKKVIIGNEDFDTSNLQVRWTHPSLPDGEITSFEFTPTEAMLQDTLMLSVHGSIPGMIGVGSGGSIIVEPGELDLSISGSLHPGSTLSVEGLPPELAGSATIRWYAFNADSGMTYGVPMRRVGTGPTHTVHSSQLGLSIRATVTFPAGSGYGESTADSSASVTLASFDWALSVPNSPSVGSALSADVTGTSPALAGVTHLRVERRRHRREHRGAVHSEPR